MRDSRPDDEILAEVRALREDLRRGFRTVMWVFLASVAMICLTFGPGLSKGTKEILVITAIAAGFFYLVGLLFQAAFNARLRKRHQREQFAILSGRTAAARRDR